MKPENKENLKPPIESQIIKGGIDRNIATSALLKCTSGNCFSDVFMEPEEAEERASKHIKNHPEGHQVTIIFAIAWNGQTPY